MATIKDSFATMISQYNRFKAFENDQESIDNVPKIAQALKAREVQTNELKLSPKTARTDTRRECITTDFFLIASKQSDKVLNATKSGNVVIWDYHEGDSQFWYFNGNFLKNKKFSSKVLEIDIEAFEKDSWGKVFLNYPNKNSESQHWAYKNQEFVSKYESKRVKDIKYKDRNLRLDVANLKTANGTGVGAYIRNREGRGRENQKWYQEFSQDLHLFDKNTPSPKVFLVVDTNIWIHYLPSILEIIYTKFHKNYEGYIVYVPWKVSHELSKIKNGNDETATRAQNANKEIDKLSKNHHPRLGLQNGIQAKYAFDRFQKMFTPQNSDDEIILCCLQLRVSGKIVRLWTKDISMRFMARSFKNIETFEWEENNCISISSGVPNNLSDDQKKFRQINTNLIQSNADSPILMLVEIISDDDSTESLDEKNIDLLVTEVLKIKPDMISSLHLELRNSNKDSNITWTARIHFTNIDDYIHIFTNGKGKTYTFGSSFKAKILNAIDDGEKNSTKFEIINPDQNIPRWEINKIIASKLSVTTSIYHGKWDSNTPAGKLLDQNIANGNYYFHAREQDFYDIDDIWVRGQKLEIRNVSKKKNPKILDDRKSTTLPSENQHPPSREIFDKLFKLIRKFTTPNRQEVVTFSDIVLKNKGACLTTVQYDTRNSISNPQEDESYLICTIKNKIFKFLNYLIIMHCDMIIFSVLCIIAIFL